MGQANAQSKGTVSYMAHQAKLTSIFTFQIPFSMAVHLTLPKLPIHSLQSIATMFSLSLSSLFLSLQHIHSFAQSHVTLFMAVVLYGRNRPSETCYRIHKLGIQPDS